MNYVVGAVLMAPFFIAYLTVMYVTAPKPRWLHMLAFLAALAAVVGMCFGAFLCSPQGAEWWSN